MPLCRHGPHGGARAPLRRRRDSRRDPRRQPARRLNERTAGTALKLSGRVAHPAAAVSSVTILRRAGTSWKRVATARLSVTHRFALTLTPAAPGTWRLVAQYVAGGVRARSKVVAVTISAPRKRWMALGCGDASAFALSKTGTLWAWGDNSSAQLGFGVSDTDAHSSPAQVGGDAGWTAVASGATHTVALKSDGTLWAWGGDTDGQLGVGDITSQPVPTLVGLDSDWAAVSCGDYYTLALKTDGTLWAWGDNGNGQLGVGDTTVRQSPTQVGTSADWAAISCGHSHALALMKDGSLWAWGYNGNGQLGLGDTDQRDAPVQVGTAMDWAAVAAGNDFSLAVKQDGTLWAWGYNGNGQLGLGGRRAPQRISRRPRWAPTPTGCSWPAGPTTASPSRRTAHCGRGAGTVTASSVAGTRRTATCPRRSGPTLTGPRPPAATTTRWRS